MLTTDEIKEIYKERLLTREPIVAKDNDQLAYLLHYLPEDRSVMILDAGCGNGSYAFKLASLGYGNVYAADLFEKIETDKFIYTQADITNLPYNDRFFDFIYCFSVIYYLPDPESGILELLRTLKNNGLLVLTAHTKYSLFTLWRKIKVWLNIRDVSNLKGVRFRSAQYYKKLLRANGFEVLRTDGFGLSFIIYPYYRRKREAFKKYLGFYPPVIMPKVTRFRWLAGLKSVIGYHSILVARKKG